MFSEIKLTNKARVKNQDNLNGINNVDVSRILALEFYAQQYSP